MGGALGGCGFATEGASPAAAAGGLGEEVVVPEKYLSPHSQQISMAEYHMQSHTYTQEALRQLKASTEYKQHNMRCKSCGRSWYFGEFSVDCQECDGHAMHRPCPICHGRCSKMWQRNVHMSHRMKQGYWDGSCGHQHAAKLIKEMMVMENITEAMEELTTEQS